ncbi:MAG TPA: GntR family transcriptional regulator [Nitrospirota bacterium]|nr:GntR family transcriptional regulator [Nitrospirota bacterium]
MELYNTVDREKHQKLYVQLYSVLKGKIENNEWHVGVQIPTEDELCKIYEVSKATVKLAVLELVREGFLRRKQGKGTFVCNRVIPEWLTTYKSFKDLLFDAGLEFTSKILIKTVTMPDGEIEDKLSIPSNRHVIYIKRLRAVHGECFFLQQIYIPYHTCPGLLEEDLVNDALFDIIEKKYGIRITKVRESIELTHPDAEDCKLLGLQEGASALAMEQHFFLKDSQVMYMRTIARPERFKFSIEIERSIDISGM